MKTQKFFFGEVGGLNAEIKRHRDYEQKLREELKEFELAGNDRMVKTWRPFLNLRLFLKSERSNITYRRT